MFGPRLEEAVVRTQSRRPAGDLIEPDAPVAVVLMAYVEPGGRNAARNLGLARRLAAAGLAVLSFDLLDRHEASDQGKAFDVELLTERFLEAIRWIKAQGRLGHLPIGLFSTGAGVAAALRATPIVGEAVRAIVCCGGRPDLAGDLICRCRTAVLYIVAEQDARLLALNAMTLPRFGVTKRLEIIEGATPSFQEPGAFEKLSFLVESWLLEHLDLSRKAPTPAN